jgi:hypothetical protein
MVLKKMMLLVGVSLVALAVPATAQADEWYTKKGAEEEPEAVGIGQENALQVELTGDLSATAPALVDSGPCLVHAMVDVWNEEIGGKAVATGRVVSFQTTTEPECPVFVGGTKTTCLVSSVTSGGFPWHISVGAETAITIAGANFQYVYTGAGCATYGIPTGISIGASGKATGTFANVFLLEGCIDFKNSGDLTNAGLGSVLLTGELCSEELFLA